MQKSTVKTAPPKGLRHILTNLPLAPGTQYLKKASTISQGNEVIKRLFNTC
jgi:hypothetical protein